MKNAAGTAMKSYRCVFSYTGGTTTINIDAIDADCAIEAAAGAISAGDYDRVEVWDGNTQLLARTTPRAWDSLGDPAATPAAPAVIEQPQTAPIHFTLPRRPRSLFRDGLNALGLKAAKDGWRRILSARS